MAEEFRKYLLSWSDTIKTVIEAEKRQNNKIKYSLEII